VLIPLNLLIKTIYQQGNIGLAKDIIFLHDFNWPNKCTILQN